MEAAGLAVGVVALASIFKECIDLFSYISASRSLGKDYELLNTKLEVEKTLLLQFADRISLLHNRRDSRLEDPRTSHSVKDVLNQIKTLLYDGESLQSRYGLKKEETLSRSHGESKVATHSESETRKKLGSVRMQRLMRGFDSLTIRPFENSDGASAVNRARWAVYDKEKFDSLLNHLSYFITKLNELVPDVRGQLPTMTMEDLSHLSSDKLDQILQMSRPSEIQLVESAEALIIQRRSERILRSCFRHRDMDSRMLSLSDPHSTTLRWALEPSEAPSEQDWDDLCHWLEHDSGIYWVSGKAGSGKSTLMKYLYGHEKTRQLLDRWSADKKLVMAHFFFYALGTTDQKTHEGLSRALLGQILKEEPCLIKTLFPDIWHQATASEDTALDVPTSGEIKSALESIKRGARAEVRFCFFIDGLDEFDGDFQKVIAFIKDMVSNPDIKIVVSSRPIPLCDLAFNRCPKLRLQDLTRNDIAKYARETIYSHSYWDDFSEPRQASTIVETIVEKASGVFLWVVIACRSLIEGFAAFDDIDELKRRVDELHPELEGLFQQMLSKLEPRYQQEAARLLHICYNATLEKEEVPLLPLASAQRTIMDPRMISLPGPMSNEQRRAKCKMMEGRIRSRCCGLLETLPDPSQHYHPDEGCFCTAEVSGNFNTDTHEHISQFVGHIDSGEGLVVHYPPMHSIVRFIHRTVFDYLTQSTLLSTGCLKVNDVRFDPFALLSCISLQSLALSPLCIMPGESKYGSVQANSRYVREALTYARVADDKGETKPVSLIIGQLEHYLQSLVKRYPGRTVFQNIIIRWIDQDLVLDRDNHPLGLFLAVEAGMFSYVKARLKSIDLPLGLIDACILHAMYCPFGISEYDEELCRPELLEWLFKVRAPEDGPFYGGQPIPFLYCEPTWIRELWRKGGLIMTEWAKEYIEENPSMDIGASINLKDLVTPKEVSWHHSIARVLKSFFEALPSVISDCDELLKCQVEYIHRRLCQNENPETSEMGRTLHGMYEDILGQQDEDSDSEEDECIGYMKRGHSEISDYDEIQAKRQKYSA